MNKTLSADIVHFLHNQGCVLVSTISKDGAPHNSCKGIIQIKPEGKIYLLDLYKGQTFANLSANPNISITALNEHKFKGYCLIGKARIAAVGDFDQGLIKAWEDRVTSRITQRVLKNISGEKGHPRHPESLLPEPKYVIVMEVKEIVDLTPHHLKQEA
ncbi:MAG: pyridoxamine 5'-phosphate oxidase family protein [Candidatus Omnitrophica bacterium]|nr:pyridoxamine 5'-phosphate oxidase family protein [Candidatus Omnitrophota bacterium]